MGNTGNQISYALILANLDKNQQRVGKERGVKLMLSTRLTH